MSILIESEIAESRRDGRMTRCRLASPGTRAAALLAALGIERLEGLVSGPVVIAAGISSAVPEFEPARAVATRRYQSKDADDFLL
jgi:hypothetical protein